jgi:hypothetical protein
MRLFLVPLTAQRSLLYCQRLNVTTVNRKGLGDKITKRATKLWADWEKKESGWQRKVVDYGNYAFRRIPYQEWGLKSIPPLSARRKEEELKGVEKVDILFPRSVIPSEKVEGLLSLLASEREALHRRKLIWSVVAMPFTIPFMLVPV